MSNQREYEIAIENPVERKRFIQGIDLGWAGPYVGRVLFKQDNNSEGDLMICRKRFYESKPKIIVFSVAFSYWHHPRYADFYSTLVHHEGYHAKQRSAQIRLDQLEEFMACINQIRNFNSRNSERYKSRIRRDIETIMQNFREFGPQILIDETNKIYNSL